MTGDELIREIQLKKLLSELDGSSVPEYDSSESMTAEELRSDNRFLIDQLKEALEENRRLNEAISEIRQDLKDANRRADEESAERKKVFDRLEKFMDEEE
jgi:signal transduction protein with GAF and PtsI domain